jgi:anthranilate phosphoribosyltransferase
MNRLAGALASLVAGQSLSREEAHDVVASLLAGEASEAASAAFLTALHIKGIAPDELAGAVAALRERMIVWDCGAARQEAIDTCGTGGDGASTVNISTATAIIVAACGVPVIKHGSRAASSQSGSADVLSLLGVSIDLEPPVLRRSLHELKIAFLFAPQFHPGLRHLAPVRSQLPFRTLFNLVGPLCNPASPAYQVVGTPLGPQADLLAGVLARLDHLKRAVVVSGGDALDEVTLDGPTHVRVIESGAIHHAIWEPEDFGLRRHNSTDLCARDAAESARALTLMLDGEKGPVRDYVLANCAAALWVARQVPLRDAAAQATMAIDSGVAADVLTRWRALRPDKTAENSRQPPT